MTNQLEFRHLGYFLILAETLHFGKAAERLFITQSALSQQIQRLEVILGHTLFIRSNRKVALSLAGLLFKEEAEIILNQVNRSIENWRLQTEGGKGVIEIGFVGSAMQSYLPELLKDFSQKHPKVNFYLQDLSNKDQILALEKMKIDIGFLRSKNISDNLQSLLVYEENLTLVLPKNHPVTDKNFVDIGQLANESYILFPNESSQTYYEQIISLCDDYGFSPNISHQSIHGPAIFKLVENGLGISIVPNSLVDKYNYKVNFIELKNIRQKTKLYCVWNKYNENPALAYLLAMLRGAVSAY